jgi:CheY-like chemotaxis protein
MVENDEDERLFMKEGFDAAGHFEVLAQLRNGDALLDWLAENHGVKPDLILSDLNMQGKNGYDILSELKKDPAYSSIPIIITSTSNAKSIIEKCIAMGAAEYIVKPDTFVDYSTFANSLYKMVREKAIVRK